MHGECAFHLRDKNANALVAGLYSHELATTPGSGHCALTWVLLRELASKISGTFIQSRHVIGMRIDKVEQTQGGHEPGRAFRSSGGKRK